MDKHSRGVELDEGVVRISGGTTPGAFPHLCPFQPKGATREFCAETTDNLQRNRAGCLGTTDHRGFAPCNSELRKCVVCIVRGEGKLKRPVVDIKRGLCDMHREEIKAPLSPPPTPTRSIHFASTLPARQRPEWAKPGPLPQLRSTTSRAKSILPATAPKKVERRVFIPNVPDLAIDPPQDLPPTPLPQKSEEPVNVDLPVGEELSRVGQDSSLEVLLTEEQIEVKAASVYKLGRREKQIALALLDGDFTAVGQALVLTRASVVTYMHGICNRLGIERGHKHASYDRLGAMRLVMARYKQLGGGSTPSQESKRKPSDANSLPREQYLSVEETKLLYLFRGMTEGNRATVLEMVRNLK